MLRRTIASVLVLSGSLMALAPVALAVPPTDEQCKAAHEEMGKRIDAMRKSGGVKEEEARAAANEVLKDLSISEMTLAQIETLQRTIGTSNRMGEAVDRLTVLAANPGVDGAAAAALALTFVEFDKAPMERQVTVVRTALRHPAMGEALKAGRCDNLFYGVMDMPEGTTKAMVADLVAARTLVTPDLSPAVLRSTRGLMEPLLGLGPEYGAQAREVRSHLARAVKEAMTSADEKGRKRLEDTFAYLDGAYARGELLGRTAPRLDVTWSSDEGIKSFDDLKGKVVLVDFWATWCGPCIAAFPHMRELREHYEGYPVEIVGVTSLQGYHMGPQGRIETKDDPEKELGLMDEFITRRNMTWPVVFTAQNVYNGDFGVVGIPHMAIIDTTGKVRFNALRPGEKAAEIEKINGLLKEAGLPAPENGR